MPVFKFILYGRYVNVINCCSQGEFTMQYTRSSQALTQASVDCLVLAVTDGKKITKQGQVIDKASNRYLTKLLQDTDFTHSEQKTLLLHQVPGCKAKRVLLVHFGEQEKLDDAGYAKCMHHGLQELKKLSIESALLALDDIDIKHRDQNWQVSQLFQALANTTYQFTSQKSEKSTLSLKKIVFSEAVSTKQINHGKALLNAMHFAKDLGNNPGNVCTPSYLAAAANKLARKYAAVKTTVYSEAQMEKMGMGSLLSVSRGSNVPAKLIAIEYKGARQKTAAPIALVGKGVTFDSGGISLKPGASMDEMKYDMMGAGSVLATMQAVAELKLPINLVVIIPTTENMPGSKATKPGDIVKSMSGKTIEVLNTDAEGRLILCDALTFVQRKFKPTCIVDVATLTGAILIALGKLLTGAFTNNEDFLKQLQTAAEDSNDKIWQMPMLDIYQSSLSSNFADIANIGNRYAGSTTAACFLARFIENDTPWVHLDIAGTAWTSGDAKGATGRPVPLLLQFLQNQCTTK